MTLQMMRTPVIARLRSGLRASVAALALLGGLQAVHAPTALADALGSPSMTAPLSANPNPISVDTGPLGKVYITGAVSGLGLVQTHRAPGDNEGLLDLSNGQVFIQTTSGPVQFFIQAGAYSLPSLGAAYLKSGTATRETFDALPVAYVKLAPTPEISILAGKLPTLIGSEYTFTFQNMNIERGLLWNQEPAVSEGVQANYAKGPVTLSVSVNDGFYSNHYNWISGLFTYALSSSDSLTFVGGSNFASTAKSTFATPLAQNNGSIFNVIFSHSAGPLLITPYFQYTNTPQNVGVGLSRSASTYSGAVLAKYSFTPTFSLAGRVEYIDSDSRSCPAGDEACAQTNLLYGPSSKAFSLTITPTYQNKLFFARGELSYVRANDFTEGDGFGSNFNARDQVRGMIETGILF